MALYIVVLKMWEKIEELANVRGMTIYALAKKAGINYTMLAELKSGKKKDMMFSNVIKIAKALDVSLEELAKS
ncbi:helix-turn-helix transcriptional regulator [Streptococcus suis]|uniref:helix-turn-helix domain-containing protein n=1 Tax=Streptococcus suis TaxID=1307 RepID=UPI00211964D1|nr:helix-turn-helix transcriptional regulator [Streptococcus suis]MCQ8272794.1 helix-turn-helix transcriptional regulator [Streptococcus suis]MDY7601263.1 helix-turn-helix transcriptional regulator [Streptococcus suis]